jgi:hypothetical protein
MQKATGLRIRTQASSKRLRDGPCRHLVQQARQHHQHFLGGSAISDSNLFAVVMASSKGDLTGRTFTPTAEPASLAGRIWSAHALIIWRDLFVVTTAGGETHIVLVAGFDRDAKALLIAVAV